MQRIGLSTLYLQFYGRPFDQIPADLRMDREEAERPEVWEIIDSSPHTLDRDRLKILGQFVKQGYRFTIHCPFEEGLNIADLDVGRRRMSLDRMIRSIDAAAELEAGLWVLHPGGWRGESVARAEELNNDAIASLHDYAGERGVRVAVENMNPTLPLFLRRPTDFSRFRERTGLDLKIVFDVGHAHIGGLIDEFIDRLGNHFTSIHCHDNGGRLDDHLGIGDGGIDWERVAKRLGSLGYLEYYVVEALSKPFESVAKLKRLIRGFG